jgi:N6-adenosine-specific RNA methylase IME4
MSATVVYDLPTFEIHPFAAIFPLVDETSPSFQNMLRDMCENGMTDPALIYQGKILDGVTRYRICNKQEDVEFIYEEFKGTEAEALNRSLSRNLHRRHLSESGRAMSALRLARTRKDTTKDREWAAELFNVSPSSVNHALTVLNCQSADLIMKVDNGDLKVSLAAGIAKLTPSAREQAMLDPKMAAQLIKKAARSERELKNGNEIRKEHNEAVNNDDPMGVYGVIYLDPPWHFEVRSDSGMDRSADNHYKTMSIEDMAEMNMPAASNCVMFMWSTTSQLHNAIDLMRGWGFTYKSCCAWHKMKAGTGYWFRDELELLLVGTKGDVIAPAMGTQMKQVQQSPQGDHSTKPESFADGINKMFPTTPSVELFARRVANRGNHWRYFGNELDGGDLRELLKNANEVRQDSEDVTIETKGRKPRNGNGKKTKPAEIEASPEQEEGPQ